MGEFQTRYNVLLKQIDNLPRTDRKVDETNRNRLKENVVALVKIQDQIDRMSSGDEQKEEIDELQIQLNKEYLSIITLGNSYRPLWQRFQTRKSGFANDFRKASIEAVKLVETLKRKLRDLRR